MLNNAYYLEMVLALGEKYEYDEAHAKTVDRLSVSLFEHLKTLHGLGENELYLLRHGALLHDIGIYISTNKHHRHSAYLVGYDIGLDGYPDKERELLTVMVGAHRKKVRLEKMELSRYGEAVLPKLIAILRVADALDYYHKGTAEILSVEVSNKNCLFIIDGVSVQSIKDVLKKKANYFEEVYGLKARFKNTNGAAASYEEVEQCEENNSLETEIECIVDEYDSGITEPNKENTTENTLTEEKQ